MAKAKWTPKSVQRQQQAQPARGRKGGYLSEKNMDFNQNQSIEELTGGRIKKKS